MHLNFVNKVCTIFLTAESTVVRSEFYKPYRLLTSSGDLFHACMHLASVIAGARDFCAYMQELINSHTS